MDTAAKRNNSFYMRQLDIIIRASKEQRSVLMLAIILMGIFGVALTIFVAMVSNDTIAIMEQEVTVIADLPEYTGAFQMLTVLIWCASATICFITGLMLWKMKQSRQIIYFWTYMGAFLAFLMVDDAFRIHEKLNDNGISDFFTYGVYGLMVIALIAFFYENLLRTSFVVAGFAGCLLASSVVLDLLFGHFFHDFRDQHYKAHFLLEDGPKILGLGILVIYLGHSMIQAMTDAMPEATDAQ